MSARTRSASWIGRRPDGTWGIMRGEVLEPEGYRETLEDMERAPAAVETVEPEPVDVPTVETPRGDVPACSTVGKLYSGRSGEIMRTLDAYARAEDGGGGHIRPGRARGVRRGEHSG